MIDSNRPVNSSYWQALILFTYFSLGAFALISQTMLLREFFVVVYGNEFIFAVLMTNWLAGIFSGAMLGGFAAERSKDNLLLLMLSIMAMCVLLPLAITGTRFLYAITGTAHGSFISFLKVFRHSALIIIPVSFFIGFAFPVAAKVQVEQPGNHPETTTRGEKVRKISSIYIFEAMGSLLSGMVYTFFLAGRSSAYLVAAMVTLPLLGALCIVARKSRHVKTFVAAVLLLALNLLALLPAINGYLETTTVQKRWRSISTMPLVYSADSRYQNIAVARMFGQYSLYLNTRFASSFPNDEENMILAAHLVCQHPAPPPEKVLIVGDAFSGLARFLLQYDVKEVTSVEIDRQVVEATFSFLPEEDKKVMAGDRFKLVTRDGRKYIKDLAREQAGSLDFVYVNVPEPSTLLMNRYYTREFFHDLAKVLKPEGVVALKITSSENYGQGLVSDYTASVYHTVKSVFPAVVVAPGVQNFIFASRDSGSISPRPEELAQRYTAAGFEPVKLGMIFYSLYPEEKTRFIAKALDISGESMMNTDETPIASLYFNKILGWYGESNLAGLLGFFENVRLRDMILVLLVLFFLRLLYMAAISAKKAGKTGTSGFLGFHTLLAVFSGGMAGLSLELVILYSFQNNFGDVYHIVGFIIAIFMLGIPLGAAAANRLISRAAKNSRGESRIIQWIILVQVVIAGISFMHPRIMKLFLKVSLLNQAVIFAETILIGVAIGIIFPLSLHIYLGQKPLKTGATAGLVDAFDHLGAAVGAFFIGTLFLPVIGLEKVCILVACLPLLTSVLLATDIFRSAARTAAKKNDG